MQRRVIAEADSPCGKEGPQKRSFFRLLSCKVSQKIGFSLAVRMIPESGRTDRRKSRLNLGQICGCASRATCASADL
jgi:hypothetical protein